MKKLFSITRGDQCGEVFVKLNMVKGTVKFCAKINGQTIKESLIFDDVRELIANMFTPKALHEFH